MILILFRIITKLKYLDVHNVRDIMRFGN